MFSRSGDNEESEDILNDVHRVLHNINMSVTNHELVFFKYDDFSAVEREKTDNLITFHGMIRFRAKTIATG